MTRDRKAEAERPSWAPPVLRGDRMEAGLRTLELEVRRRLDGLLQGNHLGLVPGPGSEPGEARPYQPGDDVRRMDWAVTARTTVPHIRETVADRELETWVVVDLSASLDFGTAAVREARPRGRGGGGDRAPDRRWRQPHRRAWCRPASEITRMPARGGLAHARGLVRKVAEMPRAKEGVRGDLAGVLEQLRRPPRRRGLAVVISDFLGDMDWQRPLRALSARHDLIAIEVLDPGTWTCRTWAPSCWPTRSRDGSVRCTRRRCCARSSPPRRPSTGRTWPPGSARPAPAHLVLRTDSDWIADTVRFVVARKRRWSGGVA